METVSVSELKTHFSAILKKVEAGEKVAIAYGRKKEIKALLVPNKTKGSKIKLGILKGKAVATFISRYNTKETEF